jgi:hypothetical protein
MRRDDLVGVGVAGVVGSVLISAALVLLFNGVVVVSSGPPRFEPTMLPTYLIASFIGFRVARWRGVIALAALLALSVARYLIPAWLAPSGPDLDFVVPHSWGVLGLVLGTALASVWRPTLPALGALGAVGLYSLALGAWALVMVCWSRFVCASPECFAAERMLTVALSLAGGFGAAAWLARPLRLSTAVALGLSLALPSLLVLADARRFFAWSDPLSLLEMASGAIGGAAFVVGAVLPSLPRGSAQEQAAQSPIRENARLGGR